MINLLQRVLFQHQMSCSTSKNPAEGYNTLLLQFIPGDLYIIVHFSIDSSTRKPRPSRQSRYTAKLLMPPPVLLPSDMLYSSKRLIILEPIFCDKIQMKNI